MRARALCLLFLLLCSSWAWAQASPPEPPPSDRSTPEQLDQLLAPIALYPDELLSKVLMAATYPLEVVEADRWLQDAHNASLTGDALSQALLGQPWDPSIKSLVPFPRILNMMDNQLGWTERLGDAFLADQAAVMDSVQRLRHRAAAAGNLNPSPQQSVTTDGDAIEIQPAAPDTVYVPVYAPLVYGPWPYPIYPPYYFPEFFAGFVVGDIGFGWWGVPVILPLWGWSHFDWHHHGIGIDPGRYGYWNHGHPAAGGSTWTHDPYHRHGVPYADSAVRERFGSAATPRAGPELRGYPAAPTGSPASRERAPAPVTERPPATFESYGRGQDVRQEAERGRQSRTSTPVPSHPSTGARGLVGGSSRSHR